MNKPFERAELQGGGARLDIDWMPSTKAAHASPRLLIQVDHHV